MRKLQEKKDERSSSSVNGKLFLSSQVGGLETEAKVLFRLDPENSRRPKSCKTRSLSFSKKLSLGDLKIVLVSPSQLKLDLPKQQTSSRAEKSSPSSELDDTRNLRYQ